MRTLLFIVAALLFVCSTLVRADEATVYPAEAWQERTPAEAGLDGKVLEQLSQYVGGMGSVVRHGYLVYHWGTHDARVDVASCCKPWFTHLLFQAIEQGKLADVEQPVMAVEPRLADLNAALDHKDRRIVWRHLANQISCYGVGERPGEAYDYSDFNMALFYDALTQGVYHLAAKQVTRELLHPALTDVLGCQDNPRFSDRGRLAISTRDFCRFGLLYLHEGNWRGRQLLSKDHVRMILHSPLENSIPRTRDQRSEMIAEQRSLGGGSNQTDHFGSYSYAWWTNGVDREGRRLWPAAPPETFACLGHAGKRAMIVIPPLDLIVCWNESSIDGREKEDRALQLLVEAAAKPAAP